MLIVFCGSIGRSVTGGMSWVNLQYLIGLRELGHEVIYLEDCGDWSEAYDWDADELRTDIDYPATFVADCVKEYGFGEHWIYRLGDDARGLSVEALIDVCSRADLLLIHGVPLSRWRKEYDLPKRRAFIDIDPGFTQIAFERGERPYVSTVSRSEVLFTVGYNLGRDDCSFPTCGREWLKTVPPVVTSYWPESQTKDAEYFTTVMRWRGMKDLEHNGMKFGQKDSEFGKFLSLPTLVDQRIMIALTGGNLELLRKHGWHVIEGWKVSKTTGMYEDFIRRSRAEFQVAKGAYVQSRSGWFSDRSACYLASGKPVLVQDTGFRTYLPVGDGILSFEDLEDAVRKIEAINENYDFHCKAAREIALQYFSTENVLPILLEQAIS